MKSAVSRVLYQAIIPLGMLSPACSSNLPGRSVGHTYSASIWSCSKWGLPCRRALLPTRCALTAPFHPYQAKLGGLAFCCTFRRLTPPRCYLALYPVEPGLSSTKKFAAIAWLTSGVIIPDLGA